MTTTTRPMLDAYPKSINLDRTRLAAAIDALRRRMRRPRRHARTLRVDVNGGATTDGARILQWTCLGWPNQQWRFGQV